MGKSVGRCSGCVASSYYVINHGERGAKQSRGDDATPHKQCPLPDLRKMNGEFFGIVG